MTKSYIPASYRPKLNLYETQVAIGTLKPIFARHLGRALNLKRVSAPLFVFPETGLNDNLNGWEKAVSFNIKAINRNAEIVHSLAKWKRMALGRYGFSSGEGLYTDMNAIRREEDMDNLHSVYVDQWDWEKVITADERNSLFLEKTVIAIVHAIINTLDDIQALFPQLTRKIEGEPSFVSTEELLQMWPEKSPKEREYEYVKDHHCTFIKNIGGKLSNGKAHDGRSPDYDDWQLNGDLLFWDDALKTPVEISSMGIRVDAKSMLSQLKEAGEMKRAEYPFHKGVINNTLPLTIGGGIGQSRLSMLLLEKVHIAEVQASVWDEATEKLLKSHHIEPL